MSSLRTVSLPRAPRSPRRGRRLRRAAVTVASVSVVALTAACGSGSDSAAGSSPGTEAGSSPSGGTTTLTVYTDQHAELVEGLTKAYTEETGTEFNVQNDATVGQVQAEGEASRADVFLSETPGPVAQLGEEGLLAPVEQPTLDQVREGLSSSEGSWVAYAARARVLFYNPDKIEESALPARLADITQPQYAGTFAWAPSDTFVATTQYLLDTIGEEETNAFLEGVKANGVDEQKNGNVRDTVEAGKHAMGLSNHYYWWVLAGQEGGPDELTSKIYHFPEEDPGNLVLSSGAGVLGSSENQDEAQEFLAWLTAEDGGQKLLADAPLEVSEGQYPVAPGVSSSVAGDLDDIESPSFDMDSLADSQQAEELLKTLGMSKG